MSIAHCNAVIDARALSSKISGMTAGSPSKIFVRDLEDKQIFTSVFLARDKTMLTGKNGKPYISVYLTDQSGSVDCRAWDNVDQLTDGFQSGDVVKVKGQVQIFQGRKQVVIHRLERALPEEFDMKDFARLGREAEMPEDMMGELLVVVGQAMSDDPSIRQLVTR